MNGQPDSVFAPAGPVAGMIAELAWVLVIGSTLIFVGVMALLAWALLRRRDEGDVQRAATARFTWRWVIGGGVIFPVLVLSALLLYNALRTDALTPARAADELVISVTGHLWWWEVRYQLPAAGIDFVTANQINLPAARPVTLGLTTADVIHSLWFPALAGKIDMVPGRVHQLRVQADRAGSIPRPVCRVLRQPSMHAWRCMRSPWSRRHSSAGSAQQARGAQPPADPQARRGLRDLCRTALPAVPPVARTRLRHRSERRPRPDAPG